MKERGIIFSGSMVRRILSGDKHQTRRPFKHQPVPPNYIQPMFGRSPDSHEFGDKYLWREVGPDYPDDSKDDRRCPYGSVGDHLYVKETWCCKMEDGSFIYNEAGEHECWYAADGIEVLKDDGDGFHETRKDGTMASPWKSPLFMPRWASRITLEITDVRVQRLNDISAQDCIAEGIDYAAHKCGCERCAQTSEICPATSSSLIEAYRDLWSSIYGPGSWDKNPWNWALTFKRVAE